MAVEKTPPKNLNAKSDGQDHKRQSSSTDMIAHQGSDPGSGRPSYRRDDDGIQYLHGARYWAICLVIATMYFLAIIDTTIASTSLVAIADDLGNFEMVSWVLTSYLLGYVAVIVILSKLSDIFGRKSVTVGCIIILTLFSAGCGAAQTLDQLIILRAFQGVGGGGCSALATVLLIESNTPEKYGDAVTRNGVAIILALISGPILGGAISENTTWRWIFLINIPVGAVVLALALVGIPNGFPYQGTEGSPDATARRAGGGHGHGHGHEHGAFVGSRSKAASKAATAWARIDVPGTLLILLATLAFTACFQEADSRFPWNSAYVISLLVASGVLWIALIVWERHVTLTSKIREPVLPWTFFTDRTTMSLLGGCLLTGAPPAVTNFQLPQRFQLINGLDNFDAAVRILPFGVTFAVGLIASGRLASNLRVPVVYLIIAGSIFQAVGYALLGTLDTSRDIQPAVYGYQVLAGLGCSLSYTTLLLTIAYTTPQRDSAVAVGAANQLRAMGSAIGLAIVTSVFNGYVRSELARLGIAASVTDLGSQRGQSSTLPPGVQDEVLNALSQGYNRQMLVLCAFGAAQLPVALLMWKRKQIVVA